MESLKVVSGPSLREQVAAKLRHAIATGHFAPGERLIERELCELTGVSRTSVREALRDLEGDGLITTVAHRGPMVAIVTPDQAQSIYEVRAALEALAARLFTLRADNSKVAQLVAASDRLEHAYSTGQLPLIFAAKSYFYQVLLEGSENEVVAQMLRSIHIRVSQLRMTSLGEPNRAVRSMAEIREIVRAVESRTSEEAARLSRIHVEHAAASALSILRNNQARSASAPIEEHAPSAGN